MHVSIVCMSYRRDSVHVSNTDEIVCMSVCALVREDGREGERERGREVEQACDSFHAHTHTHPYLLQDSHLASFGDGCLVYVTLVHEHLQQS